MTRTEYRWLLPSAMAGGLDTELAGEQFGPGSGRRPARPRRTVRDWIVDTALFVLAALVGMAAADVSDQINDSELVVLVDQLAGIAACCALWLRRRWPGPLALALTLVCLVTPVVGGAVLVSLFSLAVHRPFRPAAVIGLLSLVSACASPVIRPDPTTDLWASVIGGAVFVLLALGWGMLVRSRRQLFVVLQERAHRAETEAELRAEQAQRLAREAIAREMHDVLAHRLTLLSVHAGALEFRPDAPPAEVARAAGVIRDSAHEALQDLRQIIGVLRTPGDHESGDRPQPTLASLDALVHESREAGMKVHLDSSIVEPVAVPPALGRTVYRIAQEALTNARKHAPGAEVTLALGGAPGDGLTVAVDNPAAPTPRPITAVPGSGQGLIGLGERAMLAGGTLEHGKTGDGGFHVRAWLPWAA
ncbi:histidine kinase [Streptomyces sp. NPDC005963]|uniref:sensor histidine kinase n=1 Tax=Streptomyces sp. NPDC005963 TaxID=3156721 RepID=UPI0033C397B7